jgi:hypothetical protein
VAALEAATAEGEVDFTDAPHFPDMSRLPMLLIATTICLAASPAPVQEEKLV